MKIKNVKNLNPRKSDMNIGVDIMRKILTGCKKNEGLRKNGYFTGQMRFHRTVAQGSAFLRLDTNKY